MIKYPIQYPEIEEEEKKPTVEENPKASQEGNVHAVPNVTQGKPFHPTKAAEAIPAPPTRDTFPEPKSWGFWTEMEDPKTGRVWLKKPLLIIK